MKTLAEMKQATQIIHSDLKDPRKVLNCSFNDGNGTEYFISRFVPRIGKLEIKPFLFYKTDKYE